MLAIGALLPMAWIPFWVSPLHFVAAAIVFVMLVRCSVHPTNKTMIIHRNLFCRQPVLNISMSVAWLGMGSRLRHKLQMHLFSYGFSAPLRQLQRRLLLTHFCHQSPH